MGFKLLGVSGSLRADSTNTAALRAAGELAGDDVKFTLADIDFPLYSGDIEAEGIPAKVTAFAEALREADAVVISTPEYNGALSGALKNALDWQSRIRPFPIDGKPVAIMSVTGGPAGGLMAQTTLRQCLTAFDIQVLHKPFVTIGSNGAEGKFQGGRLMDESAREAITAQMQALRAAAAGAAMRKAA